MNVIRVRMRGKRVIISYKKITVVFLLHPQEVFQGTEIVPKVKIAC